MNLVYAIALLLVTSPGQAPCEKLMLPGEAGAVVIQWEPNAVPAKASKPNLIFNHFVCADGLLLSTYYKDSYQIPILRLSVGRVHHIYSKPCGFERGKRYEIWAFWRHVGNTMEMGLYVDGKLVGYLWEPAKSYKTWAKHTYIGARGLEPVNDPSFPSVQHIDGRMSIWIWGL